MDYENRPLVEKLVKFKEANPTSLHVPGHKNGMLSGLPVGLRSALSFDLTELEGLDDLHQPEGAIKEAEQKLTNLYRSDKSFFLVNGSTVGNLAMVYATCGKDDTVIVQRNAHKSIFNAIELTGARPVFISPGWDRDTRTAGGVSSKRVRIALEEYPEAKAVILTYPTYYGVTGSELEETIRLCHEQNIPVLVDEAHGAHFVIGEPFPSSSLELGADVVVHSAHKTLPAMTMASFLHVKSTLITPEKIAHYLRMLQSSSPSYLLMASLDDARAYAESFTKEDQVSFLGKQDKLVKRLNEISGVETINTDDPLKLMMRVSGYSGFDLQREMDKVGLYAELADPYQVLFVLPLLKKEQELYIEDIAKKVENAICGLPKLESKERIMESRMFPNMISTPSYTVSELKHFKTEWIPYEKAVGMVAASSIIPYPPGIPLLLAGERVTKLHIQSLTSLLTMKAKFQGAIRVNEKEIFVVTNDAEE